MVVRLGSVCASRSVANNGEQTRTDLNSPEPPAAMGSQFSTSSAASAKPLVIKAFQKDDDFRFTLAGNRRDFQRGVQHNPPPAKT
jgi:hypothetical protein